MSSDLDECRLCGSLEWDHVPNESGMRQCSSCGARWHKSWGDEVIEPLFVDGPATEPSLPSQDVLDWYEMAANFFAPEHDDAGS